MTVYRVGNLNRWRKHAELQHREQQPLTYYLSWNNCYWKKVYVGEDGRFSPWISAIGCATAMTEDFVTANSCDRSFGLADLQLRY